VTADPTDLEQYIAAVNRERGKLADLEAEQRRLGAAQVEAESSAGADVAAAPENAQAVAQGLHLLREQRAVVERAIAVQLQHVVNAERTYLAAAAAEHRRTVLEPAAEAHATHQDETARLLRLLERHEGRFVLEAPLLLSMHDVHVHGRLEYAVPKSVTLIAAVKLAQIRQDVVEDLAEGIDPAEPHGTIDRWRNGLQMADDPVSKMVRAHLGDVRLYPDSVWGAGALVPAREFVRQLERARETVAELRRVQTEIPGRIRGDEARLGEQQATTSVPVTSPELEVSQWVAAALPGELERARVGLQELGGDVTDDPAFAAYLARNRSQAPERYIAPRVEDTAEA
jgi:hypothetical protein